MTFHSLDTQYNGYKFRSRLEARWAVFFDALNVAFEYEFQGFSLPTAPYLPDFFLPTVRDGMWCEIKPRHSKDGGRAEQLMSELTSLTQKDGVILYGDPLSIVEHLDGSTDGPWIQFKAGGSDGSYYFCLCPWCGRVGFEFDGRGARVCGYKTHYQTEEAALAAIKHLGHYRADDKCYTGQHQRIVASAAYARGMRF